MSAPVTVQPRRLSLSTPGSVAAMLPWVKHDSVAHKREWARTVAEARRQCHDRKVRVKAHPDLAARLVRSLGYQRFDQWTGYVPPLHDQDGAFNTSPARRELIDILNAVLEREAE